MNNIKQIREQFDLITEKEEKEDRKLSALVRAGLYDAKKLPALKKALEKSADKMTSQEKRMLLNLLDSLISQVVSDDQVYRKVRQNVHSMNEAKEDYLSKFDPRFKAGYPSDKDIPSVLILKRKAIRVYPDNQKVALYYSQALDKYVTIPFSDIQLGVNEEIELTEETSEERKKRISAALSGSRTGKMLRTGKVLPTEKSFASRIKTAAKNISDVKKRSGASIAAGVATGNILKAAFNAPGNALRVRNTKKKLQARLARREDAKVNVTENFNYKLNILREERNLQEGKVSDFAYNDLDDVSLTSVGKDLTPGLGTARAAERTKRAWKKGSYGSAALNAVDTALSGVSDAALAVPVVGTAASAAIKGGLGAIKGLRSGYKAYKAYRAAKTAKTANKVDNTTKVAKTVTKTKKGKFSTARNLPRKVLRLTGKAARLGVKGAALAAGAAGAAAGGNDNSYVLSKNADPQLGKSSLFKSASGFSQSQDSKKATAERSRQAQVKALTTENNDYVLSKNKTSQFRLTARTSGSKVKANPNAARQARIERQQLAALTNESVIDTIKSIVENNVSEQTIRFNENEITINNTVAKKLLNVYESVNKSNKKKMEQMLNESATSFNKVLTFAVRQ